MTIHSDWGDWLPTAIAAAEPDGLAVWYLGCNGFALKAADGTTVFIDPYLGTGDPPRTVRMIPVPFEPTDVVEADAVLATHDHTDHTHGPSQAPILTGTDATFYGPPTSVATAEAWTDEHGVDGNDIAEITEGETLEVGSLRIHVEPAHDPDADHPVGYVVEHESGTFFHGGDARPSEDFEAIGGSYDIDLGAVAFGSAGMIPDKETREPKYTQWYSNENMAAEAAAQLQLDRLLPTHWDMWKGLTADPTALRDHTRSFDHPRTLEILEIGDRTSV
ncbi:metal-dependent hydrolase domain protein [Natronomonas pharaonis DSM 2160]|uniref:Metal-dependent hydrolase domain protein n=1 Tax=Natronomonas pharaonis (strain ATCC 35678 / DSM 2160 / CIP 103997 / JCM 8858 / NBRC 14720 / NCIMB 2260 / Gabara) TaxID=348780 RepID=A0A1U7EX20_NATPD|nr:MBL fold metallo-hydrolase [Natronomonas pharaonis]CAI49667.1 metal-dependent hydrolase domain protein [Natronomonas pharaonis DSM 2160]